MPFKIIRNDITQVKADAVVNAANPQLTIGSGVCGAIFSAAGKELLKKECDLIGGCETGDAVITKGYNLPAKYIIHTVGPVWHGGNHNEKQLLINSYKNSLKLAVENKCESIAFPLISSGVFGYPKEKALETAIKTISDFLDEHEIMVFLVVYDKKSFQVSSKRLYQVEKFIDDNYIDEKRLSLPSYNAEDRRWIAKEQRRIEEEDLLEITFEKASAASTIDELQLELEETFSQMLLRLIDERGMTDPQTYKRANITRQHFSKIKNKKDYQPKKVTAAALAVALMLNLEDTNKFLNTAGMTLSRSIKFDMIIAFHIIHGIYDIYQINEVLFAYDMPLLGA